MPFFCRKINTAPTRSPPTPNTSHCEIQVIAECYPDVAVNSPHPVRDIGEFRFPKNLLTAVDGLDRFVIVDLKVHAIGPKIHCDGIAGADHTDRAQ